MQVSLPYGKTEKTFSIPEEQCKGILVPPVHSENPVIGRFGRDIVREAMAHPIGTPRLSELAVGKKNVVLIASDHTRPVPSRDIIPLMLAEIREGNPEAEVTILVATGCHRETTEAELRAKFGDEIFDRERIVVHDCDDEANLVELGTLPSGAPARINRLAYEADLLVAEGFIEPHFFAGFSGGRKSVLPGVAARLTVLGNHCSEFIDDPKARTGILDGNPIHEDMVWAARHAKLAYIVNVILDEKKQTRFAFAGDCVEAHRAGCEKLRSLCGVKAVPADIVITSNGGYPLDQNIYQAVKGMTGAEPCVRPGGVIIMLAASEDGNGSEAFYHQLADEPDIEKTLALFMSRGRDETVPDQWQTQIFIRVLQRADVVYVSEAPDDIVRDFHMIPAHSPEEALAIAEDIVRKRGITTPDILVIPDGVGVLVEE